MATIALEMSRMRFSEPSQNIFDLMTKIQRCVCPDHSRQGSVQLVKLFDNGIVG
jgi:hypothetical protein